MQRRLYLRPVRHRYASYVPENDVSLLFFEDGFVRIWADTLADMCLGLLPRALSICHASHCVYLISAA